jgi:hypothetical protein
MEKLCAKETVQIFRRLILTTPLLCLQDVEMRQRESSRPKKLDELLMKHLATGNERLEGIQSLYMDHLFRLYNNSTCRVLQEITGMAEVCANLCVQYVGNGSFNPLVEQKDYGYTLHQKKCFCGLCIATGEKNSLLRTMKKQKKKAVDMDGGSDDEN